MHAAQRSVSFAGRDQAAGEEAPLRCVKQQDGSAVLVHTSGKPSPVQQMYCDVVYTLKAS